MGDTPPSTERKVKAGDRIPRPLYSNVKAGDCIPRHIEPAGCAPPQSSYMWDPVTRRCVYLSTILLSTKVRVIPLTLRVCAGWRLIWMMITLLRALAQNAGSNPIHVEILNLLKVGAMRSPMEWLDAKGEWALSGNEWVWLPPEIGLRPRSCICVYNYGDFVHQMPRFMGLSKIPPPEVGWPKPPSRNKIPQLGNVPCWSRRMVPVHQPWLEFPQRALQPPPPPPRPFRFQ
jgi:hypothetical protein